MQDSSSEQSEAQKSLNQGYKVGVYRFMLICSKLKIISKEEMKDHPRLYMVILAEELARNHSIYLDK